MLGGPALHFLQFTWTIKKIIDLAGIVRLSEFPIVYTEVEYVDVEYQHVIMRFVLDFIVISLATAILYQQLSVLSLSLQCNQSSILFFFTLLNKLAKIGAHEEFVTLIQKNLLCILSNASTCLNCPLLLLLSCIIQYISSFDT